MRERRKRVTKRSSEGNADNSSASVEDNVIINTATASDILQAKSISNNGVGSGIKSVARMVTRPIAMITLLWSAKGVLSVPGELDLSATAIMLLSPKQNLLWLCFIPQASSRSTHPGR